MSSIVIESPHGLTAPALDAIAALERRCLAVDGGRLKLEWHTLRRRPDVAGDVLAREGDRLVGFLGIYAFGGQDVELTGMVDPERRRQGIGAALLDTALRHCRDRGCESVLLVVPREPAHAARLAQRRGATFDHSEHAMLQTAAPPAGPLDERVTLRPAVPGDAADLGRILVAAFGDLPFDPATQDLTNALAIERDGALVGTLRVERDGGAAGIYGVAVDPALQGRGIGRTALRQACLDVRAAGVTRVRLEVAVENDRALGLYTSLGFQRVVTEDYWRLAVPAGD